MEYHVSEEELEGLIFDCDGTLVNTMPAYWWALRNVCKKFGLYTMTEKRFYELGGMPIKDLLQMLIDEADLTTTVNVDDVMIADNEFNLKALTAVGTPSISCVVSIAKAYHGKKPMAVASSGNRSDVIESLRCNGILDLFDVIVTREDITNPKPAPDVYLKAAELLKCNPRKCRGFEDGEVGVKALIAAGLEVTFVKDLPGYPRAQADTKDPIGDPIKFKRPIKDEEVEGLIFDCDGTLVDTMPAYWWALDRCCQHFGLTTMTEKRFYDLAGMPINDLFQMLIDEAGLSTVLTVKEVSLKNTEFNKQAITEVGTPLIDCVVEIARAWKGKRPMAVASSGNRKDVWESLKSNGIFDLFDVIITREDIIKPKPAPDIYLKAAFLLGCDPAKCRGYEDGVVGLKALISAGLSPIYVKDFRGYPLTDSDCETDISSHSSISYKYRSKLDGKEDEELPPTCGCSVM